MNTAQILGVLLAGGSALLAGCVERRITIATEPTGAMVYVNDVEMGRAPVTFPFLWYGDYDVRLRLDRNEGTADSPKIVQYYLHTHRVAEAPPFQWMGIDLFAELLPLQFKDEKTWGFIVPAAAQPTDEQLIADAKALKARMGATTEPGAQTQPAATQPTVNP